MGFRQRRILFQQLRLIASAIDQGPLIAGASICDELTPKIDAEAMGRSFTLRFRLLPKSISG